MTNLQILFETQAPLPPFIGYVIFGALTEEFSQCPEADSILEGVCPEYIEMNDDWDVELKQLSVLSFPPPHTAEPYYPPEYINGHVWDAPCSVFALCAILYEILTDELPYIGAMPEDMLEPGQWAEYMSTKRQEGHLDLTSIPPALHGLMTKGLQLQRKYRYRSLKTLFKDFAKLSYEDFVGNDDMY